LIGLAYDGSPLALLDGTDDGQVDVERRALALARLDPHVPLHPPRELPADVEPEAGSADAPAQGWVDSVELAEDLVLLGHGDADAVVADGEADPVGARLELEPDAAAVGRDLDGVVEEVDQDWPQAFAVGDGLVDRLAPRDHRRHV